MYKIIFMLILLLFVGCSDKVNKEYYISRCQQECQSKGMTLGSSSTGVPLVTDDSKNVYCNCVRIITLEKNTLAYKN